MNWKYTKPRKDYKLILYMSDRLTLKGSRVGVAELSESIRSHPALHKRRSRFQALITLIAGDNGRRQCQISKLTQLTHVLIKWSTPLHLIVTLNESLFGFCFLTLDVLWLCNNNIYANAVNNLNVLFPFCIYIDRNWQSECWMRNTWNQNHNADES